MKSLFVKGTFLAALAACGASVLWQPAAQADDRIRGDVYTPEIHRAVERGLEWLAQEQNENGSWTCDIGYKLNEDYVERGAHEHVCVTAIAGMAFLAAGHVPGQGKYGENVQKALDFVLSCVRESDGYITKNGTRMYEHAFATMFLSEIYGMSRRQDVADRLRDAVRCIINSQNREGGWRYQPTPVDADLSVTVSTLQALRAARNVGISVPKSVIDNALKYIKGCATNGDGSFNYQTGRGMTRTTFPLTACGVVALNSAGEYDSPAARKGIQYLRRYQRQLTWGDYHYMYGHYYAVQAFYVHGGQEFEDYYKEVSRQLLARQDGGHWDDDVGPVYATAMACVILQVPCEYLPIFQK